jgi:hypothetical protein
LPEISVKNHELTVTEHHCMEQGFMYTHNNLCIFKPVQMPLEGPGVIYATDTHLPFSPSLPSFTFCFPIPSVLLTSQKNFVTA